MNKGGYKPGSQSKDLRRTFSISFGTTNPDGSGFESVRFSHQCLLSEEMILKFPLKSNAE